MNTKTATNLLMVTCLVAGAAWWWLARVPAPKNEPVVPRPRITAAPAESPPPAPPPAEAEAVVPPLAPVAEAPAAAPARFDPQTELITAIPDFIRLAQAGDFATLMLTYMPPDALAKVPEEQRAAIGQMMQTQMQSPQGQQRLQSLIADMQAVQNTAPALDSTGTRATYTLPAGSPEPTVVFVKVNGRWYRE